ncbi:MAG: hypothetical protein LBI73_00130 [Myroides sp.]|nr:hypothetical protein [Myroides sp.]
MKKIILLLCLVSLIDMKAQNIDSKIKETIYQFIDNENQYNNRLDWNNKAQLNSLIYIEPIHSNIKGIDIHFFRVTLKPLRAYLLISQKDNTIIIGTKNKDMFQELKELYDFLLCSEEDKLDFFQHVSNNLFFIYRNNLEVENSNRIKVKAEYIN